MAVVRSQSILLLSAITGMAVSLAMTVVAGCYAGDAGFALFALVAALLAVARDLTDLGTTAVVVRAATHDPAAEQQALEDLLTWRLAPAGVLALACLGFAVTQSETGAALVLMATAAVIVAMHSNGLIAVFQLRNRLDRPALVHIAAQLGTLVATAAVAALALPGRAWAMVIVGRELVIVLANRWMVRRTLGFLPRVTPGRGRLRAVFGATSLYAGAALLFHLVINSGTFVVRLLAPDATFNAYAAAFRLMTPAFSLPWIITAPLVPVFSRAALVGGDALERQADYALLLAAGGSAVLAAAGMLLAPSLIDLVYGGRFGTGMSSAAMALQLLMPGFCGVAVAAVRAPVLLAAGDEAALLRLTAIAFAVALVGQSLLVPYFGAARGAAAAALAAVVAGALPLGTQAARLPPAPAIAVALLPALAVAAGIWFVPIAPGALRIVWGTTLSATALAALWHLPQIARRRAELAWQGAETANCG